MTSNDADTLACVRRALDTGDRDALRNVIATSFSWMYVATPEDLDGAEALLRREDNTLPADFAWRAGYAHHTRGLYERAADIYARAEIERATGIDLAHLRAVESSTAWARGDAPESRRLANDAVELARRSGDDGALAFAWVSQALTFALEGDRNANYGAYQRALGFAHAADDVYLQARIHNNLGSLANEEGRYRDALAQLRPAVELSERLGHAPSMALPRYNLAESRISLGQMDEALVDFRAAHDLWKRTDSPLVAIAALGLGETHRLHGNAAQATAAYREAIELGTHHGNAQAVVPAMAGLARTTFLDAPDAAEDLVARALAQPAALGHVQVQLAAGWVTLCAGKTERALEFGKAAEQEAGRRHDARGIAEALELLALADDPAHAGGRLGEAEAIWDATENPVLHARNQVITARLQSDQRAEALARSRLRALGVRDSFFRIAGPLMAIGDPEPAPITIHTLGTFSVFREDEPVPGSAWQSRKARDLVKILTGRSGRPIARETVAELLWPGDDGNTANRLSVLLSNIRTIFDPDRAHDADHFIIADRSAIRINTEVVRIDADEFRELARSSLEATASGTPGALGQLQEAAAKYVGHYLEDDPYLDWAVGIRDELLELSLTVRREVARLFTAADQPENAIAWLVGLLADDPYDEPVHQQLVRILAVTGRHGEARRFYEAYRSRMAEIDAAATDIADIVGDPVP